MFAPSIIVMAGTDPAIHVSATVWIEMPKKSWITGPSPVMTTNGIPARNSHGPHGAPPVAAAIRVHRLVPHHLPILHDRVGGVAHRARGAASVDRASALPAGLRVLAQDLRCRLRARRRLRDCHGIPIRHQLERVGGDVRTHPGPASRLRDLHRQPELHEAEQVAHQHREPAVARQRDYLSAVERRLRADRLGHRIGH